MSHLEKIAAEVLDRNVRKRTEMDPEDMVQSSPKAIRSKTSSPA